jgi:hypothetical protein
MTVIVSCHPAPPNPMTPTDDDPSSALSVNPHVSSTPVSPSRPNVLISDLLSTHVVDVHPKDKVSIVPKSPVYRTSTVNTELAKSTLVNEDSSSRTVPHVSPTRSTRVSRTSSLVRLSVPAKSGPSKSDLVDQPKMSSESLCL